MQAEVLELQELQDLLGTTAATKAPQYVKEALPLRETILLASQIVMADMMEAVEAEEAKTRGRRPQLRYHEQL